MASRRRIGFIGLGVMGYPMAINLKKKIPDEDIVICDLNRDAVDAFVNETQGIGKGKVKVVETAAEVVLGTEMVITVMPSSDAVKAVYLDPTHGLLHKLKEHPPTNPKILIECGTISLDTIQAVSKATQQLGSEKVIFIDAPISGGPIGSKSGTLSFMVGCPASIFPELKWSLFVHMGKEESIFHCGECGSGTAFKTINNYVSIINILASSEGYAIATRLGLDLKKLTDVFNQSSGQNWVISNNNPVPGIHPKGAASNNYLGGFRLELAMKDLGLGAELAKQAGVENSLNRETLRVLSEVQGTEGFEGRDARIVYRWLCEKEKKD